MRRGDERTLIDRGRKAGLGTRELYDALAARQPDVGDRSPLGEADGNGFVLDYNRQGQRVYHPFGTPEGPGA